MRGQVLLTQALLTGLDGKKGGKIGERKGRREKGRDFRERDSNFSLNFPAIEPSVSGEARSKVTPHGKGYAWVPVL